MKSKKNRKGIKIFLAIIISIILLSSVAFGVACAVLGTEIVTAAVKNVLAAPVNNIKAAWLFITNDSASIESQITETQKNFDDAVKDVTGIVLSDEIKAALESGRYTEEEMLLIISGVPISEIDRRKQLGEDLEQTSEKTETQTQPPEISDDPITDVVVKEEAPPVTEAENEEPVEEPEKEPVDESVILEEIKISTAKMYAIKNKFMKKLESVEQDIIKEYVSYPIKQRNPTLRKSIAAKYLSSVAELELECNAEVELVLQELKTKLVAAAKDLSVLDTIRKTYEDEKSLKKAYYMDIYLNGLSKK